MLATLPHPLLILAPHPDDVALSCAALLEHDRPVDIVTVFAGEPETPQQGPWDALGGFASSAESIPARRREEQEALADTPHRLRFLDLPDLQYVGARPASHARQIGHVVTDWLRTNPAGAVAAPAGAGWRPGLLGRLPQRLHLGRVFRQPGPLPCPDHIYLRDAVVAADVRTTILLYEELPYLWAGAADAEVERLASSTGLAAEPLTFPVDRARKAARIACYRSQLRHISAPGRGRIDDAASLPPFERYWRLVPVQSRSDR